MRAAASTAASAGGNLVQGALYWIVDPSASSDAYAPTVLSQGYAPPQHAVHGRLQLNCVAAPLDILHANPPWPRVHACTAA